LLEVSRELVRTALDLKLQEGTVIADPGWQVNSISPVLEFVDVKELSERRALR
jgi:hypothetical protein